MITRLELLDLHERLSAVLRRHQEWNVLLLRAAGRRHSIQDVVDTAAELAGGALFLLNAGCRVVYFGGRACLDSAPAREMLERGLLSPNTARDLLEEGRTDSAIPLCRVMGSEGRCWSRRVLQDDSLISHMLLFTPATGATVTPAPCWIWCRTMSAGWPPRRKAPIGRAPISRRSLPICSPASSRARMRSAAASP